MTYRMLIDGALTDGASTLEVVNPATGRVFASCARADQAQLELAIAAAKRAFKGWSSRSSSERGMYLKQLADALEARLPEFATLLTKEQGKPLDQAQGEVFGSIMALRFYAELDTPPKILSETAQERVIEHRTPLGVVAAIAPWNFPLLLMTLKLAPALVAGNTVIAKPAPTTPLTTLLLGELAAELFPPGVFTTIADANDLGAYLTSHPDVAAVSFTGSTATGRKVVASGAGTLKRLMLELGGNDAAIILDDMTAADAAPRIFQAAMLNAGQICLAAKRIYAPRAIYDELCAELAKLAQAAVVDDGLKPGVQIGPVQNRAQYEKLLGYLQEAAREGKVVAGGEPLDRAGFFIPPTIVRDLPDSARLVQEEQFGPVLPILVYDDLDDAIARANNTEYGLGATIWTSNPERGASVAMRIDTGVTWVNRHLELPFNISMGGAKQSGLGRQQGIEGLEAFSQAKVVSIALS